MQPVATSSTIAFYAYMSASIQSVTIQHSLNFDVVKTNVGNGYHPSTGVFIAPETGVYVFTWTMREASDCTHSTQLMVNTTEIGIIRLQSVAGGDFVGTGVVVVSAISYQQYLLTTFFPIHVFMKIIRLTQYFMIQK